MPVAGLLHAEIGVARIYDFPENPVIRNGDIASPQIAITGTVALNAVGIAQFRSGKYVDNVPVFKERTDVIACKTGVVIIQCVILRIVKTAFSHDYHRQSVGKIRILPQEIIVVDDAGRFRSAVSRRHIGLVQDAVFAGRFGVTDRTQCVQFQAGYRFETEVYLHFCIQGAQINIIVFHFLLDVEIGVIPAVKLVSVHGPRRIKRIAERIDVEIALVFAFYNINLAVDRSRRFLDTDRRIAQYAERQFRRNIIRSIPVESKTVYAVGGRPSRIVVITERNVVGRLVGTGRDRYGMLLGHGMAEQFVEPVGIPERSLLQISHFGRIGIVNRKTAVFIPLVCHLIPFTENTAVFSQKYVGTRKSSAGFQFHKNRHLIF